MNPIEKNPFLHTIFQLRRAEDLVLYSRLVAADPDEALLVTDLLEEDYALECLEYPGTPPAFEAGAALWGARTLYMAAQLLLYREHKKEELPDLFLSYKDNVNPGVILSADLCLRFLPRIRMEMHRIDPDDALIPIVDDILLAWPYSAIGCISNSPEVDFSNVLTDICLAQLYVDRIITRKDSQLALHPQWQDKIRAAAGIHQHHFWKELAP